MTWAQKYQVPSGSSDIIYTVGISDEGKWACSCVGWTRHVIKDENGVVLRDEDGAVLRNDCTHIKQVRRRNGDPLQSKRIFDAMEREDTRRQATRTCSVCGIVVSPSVYLDVNGACPLHPTQNDLMKRPGRLIDLPD